MHRATIRYRSAHITKVLGFQPSHPIDTSSAFNATQSIQLSLRRNILSPCHHFRHFPCVQCLHNQTIRQQKLACKYYLISRMRVICMGVSCRFALLTGERKRGILFLHSHCRKTGECTVARALRLTGERLSRYQGPRQALPACVVRWRTARLMRAAKSSGPRLKPPASSRSESGRLKDRAHPARVFCVCSSLPKAIYPTSQRSSPQTPIHYSFAVKCSHELPHARENAINFNILSLSRSWESSLND